VAVAAVVVLGVVGLLELLEAVAVELLGIALRQNFYQAIYHRQSQ
jgi:hypothetical protein